MTKKILQIVNNLTITNDNSLFWNIGPFNNIFFIVAKWKKDEVIKIQIYEIKTLKKVYEWESEKKYFSNSNCWEYLLYKLNNNEYLLKNLIIKIENNN